MINDWHPIGRAGGGAKLGCDGRCSRPEVEHLALLTPCLQLQSKFGARRWPPRAWRGPISDLPNHVSTCQSHDETRGGIGAVKQFQRREYRTNEGLLLVADVGGPQDAPAVVLQHGGGQTRHSWYGAMHRLIAEGFHVVSFDARGHGDSDWSPTGAYSLAARGDDLRVITADIAAPVALVGASMGGMTSFYAVGHGLVPQTQALVLVDIVLRPAAAGVDKIRRFMAAHQDGFATLTEASEAVAAYNPERHRPNDASGLMKNLRYRDGRLHWHWDPRIMEEDPSAEPPAWTQDLLAASTRVVVPTLLVRGEHSDIVDDAGVAELLELVPQTSVYCVAKAGHMVAGDKNDDFNDGVVTFLRQIGFGKTR
jgi:pimeloyl-ACP methyl ester carboxylesterase